MTIIEPTSSKKARDTNRAALLGLALLLTVCFCLATDLSRWFQAWQGNRAGSANLMTVAMGDARQMFANHFFVKADAYFHSGVYPSIYDNLQSYQTPHIAEDSGATKSKNSGDETAFLGPPRNWIDAFGRQFYPTVHTHLNEGGANGGEDESAVREVLPWLKLSSELDPKQVRTYVVAAYWLRRMGKIEEAEQFLRDGLKENPGDPQLLFDLGRLYADYRHDAVHARHVWEAGLHNLAALPDKEKEENVYIREGILAALARLEEQTGNAGKAIGLLEQLKEISPHSDEIQKWIDRVKQDSTEETKSAK